MGCVVQGRRCRRRSKGGEAKQDHFDDGLFRIQTQRQQRNKGAKARAGHELGSARLARPPAITAEVTKSPDRSTNRSRTHRC